MPSEDSRAALAGIVLGCLLSGVAAAQAPPEPGFVLVVHGDNPTGSLPKPKIARIFLKKELSWDWGDPALPVDHQDSALREGFSRAIHDKRASAVKSYWQRMIFSGRDVPPPELASDQEVLSYVRSHRGAIGYISTGTGLGPGVKALEATE